MTEAAAGLAIALVVTLVAAPLVRRVMLWQGVLDVPNHRSSHAVPTPRGGGLACALGIAAAVAALGAFGASVLWPAVLAAGLLAAVGFVDDRRTLAPSVRLGVQVVAGAALGVAAGGGWWIVLAIVVTASTVNVVNFMDGINGMSGMTMAVWGVTTVVVAVHSGSTGLAVLGAITAGSALGFLPSNITVAKLFLGDVGSYLFGGMVAGAVVHAWASDVSVVLLVAPLTLYLVDTATVIIRRAVRRAPLHEAHREHVYQRLTSECGLPHVTVAAGAAALSTAVTASWALGTPWFAASITVIASAAYLSAPRLNHRSRTT